MKQKGLAPILIVLLIALGIGGYLLYQKQSKSIPQSVVQPSSSPVTSSASSSAETAKPDSIGANWKAYTNDKMKFSMKVPPSWFAHPEEKTVSGYSVVFSYPIDNSSSQNWKSKQRALISIGVFPNNGKKIDQQTQERVNMPKSNLKKQTQQVKVDAEQGVILLSENGHYEEILINHQASTYLISLGTPAGDKTQSDYPNVQLEEITPIFNQILSTFKFTN